MKSYHPCPSSWLGPLFFAAAFLFCGCVSSGPIKIDTNKFFKRDMLAVIDGETYEGFAVLPDKPTGVYDITVEARGDLSVFSLSSCSKEINAEAAWNVTTPVPAWRFWERKLINKRKYHFQYGRDQLERALSICQIQLEGLNESQGKHSWFNIDIQDDKTTLPAWVTCNLSHDKAEGVSICQNQAGAWMEIVFEEDVRGDAISADCVLPVELSGKLFRWQIKEKKCIYNFKGNKSGKFHRLTTLGWNDFLIRN